jgi:hypothetical protein
MSSVIKDIDLINYSHDRHNNYKITANEIFNLVNLYTNQKELNSLYKYFEEKYQLPEKVVKQKIRQQISRSYLYRSGKFNPKLGLKGIPKSFLMYGALFYALFFSKRKPSVNNFKLIVDGISDGAIDINFFKKLVSLVGKKEVLFLINKGFNLEKDFSKYNLFNNKRFHCINLLDLIKSLYYEFFIGIWVVLKVSIQTRVNLFPAALQIIHSYLTYKAIFESNRADYLIQLKHYETDPVKNYLFKRSGGIAATTLQKNIIQADPIFFYLDADIFFSLGDDGFSRIFEYGGRIDCVQPVGSLFMETNWFNQKLTYEKKYDVAILGINGSKGYERLDSFKEFMSDYYSIYQWAIKLSIERPEYNIVLIHHTSAEKDYIEENMLAESNIKVIDKMQNSYEVGFSSKCAITYGSTMGYELNAHNLPTFFIDPGYRCSLLPERGAEYIDKMRIDSYEKFYKSITKIIDYNQINTIRKDDVNKWCLESSQVSNRIASMLEL